VNNELSSFIRDGEVDTVREWLVRYPSLIEAPDDEGELPLEVALSLPEHKAEPIVRSLLEHGASVFAIGSLALPIIESVILSAQFEGDVSQLRLLLRLGMDADVVLPPVEKGIVPLMRASWSSREMVRLLLNHGADVNIQDAQGWSPLMFACSLDQTDGSLTSLDHLDIVNDLLRAGADVTLRNNQGFRAIDIVRCSSWVPELGEMIERLVS